MSVIELGLSESFAMAQTGFIDQDCVVSTLDLSGKGET